MIPNADCRSARKESESGGSRIVSSHFDAELKTLAEKKKKIKRLPWKKERGKGEEKEGAMRNMLTPFAYVHSPLLH